MALAFCLHYQLPTTNYQLLKCPPAGCHCLRREASTLPLPVAGSERDVEPNPTLSGLFPAAA
jgi:hypothetical protein